MIDSVGFGINIFPTIYFGYENYKYEKVYVFYFGWLLWEIAVEFKK